MLFQPNGKIIVFVRSLGTVENWLGFFHSWKSEHSGCFVEVQNHSVIEWGVGETSCFKALGFIEAIMWDFSSKVLEEYIYKRFINIHLDRVQICYD